MTDTKIEEKSTAKFREGAEGFLYSAVWFGAGFLFSVAKLSEKISPFGISAVSAAPRKTALSAALGTLLGYTLMFMKGGNLYSLGGALLALAIKQVFGKYRENISFAMMTALVSAGMSTFGNVLTSSLGEYTVLLAAAETALSVTGTYFFYTAGASAGEKKPFATLNMQGKASLLMVAVLAFSVLTDIKILGVSLGGALFSAAVIFFAGYGKISMGSIAGIAAGTASFLTSKNPLDFMSYSLGGFVSGSFYGGGKWLRAFGFIAARFLVAVLLRETGDFSFIYEALPGALLFLLVPERKLLPLFGENIWDGENSSATVRDILLTRLREASFALEEIGRATEKLNIEQKIPKISLSSVAGKTAEAVCGFCPKRDSCWKDGNEETPLAFKEMLFAVKSGAEPGISESFRTSCDKSSKIFEHLKKDYEREALKNSAKIKISGARKTLSKQFSGTSELLDNMEKELSEISPAEKKISSSVRKIFCAHDLPLIYFACYYREKNYLTVEAISSSERVKNADMKAIKTEIEDLCSRDLVFTVKETGSGAQKIILSEKPLINVDFGSFSMNAEGEKFCGDSSDFFLDGKGNAVMVLSDGMGSGKTAAKDSFLALSYVSKLQKAGFCPKTSMNIVNSALVLKSDEESFSTVDSVIVDLFSGKADFYKSGAAPSFVIKKNKVKVIENVSLPVGLLDGGECKCRSEFLAAEDMIVLVSDGVTATGEGWLPSEIRSLSELSAEEMARSIAKTAFSRRNDDHSDDITVMVAKFSEAV